MTHVSVLLKESLDFLNLETGKTIIDGTFGAGGHSLEIARAIGKSGRLISFDADGGVFTEDKIRELGCLTQFTRVHENFRNMGQVLKRLEIDSVDGVLLDLGLSSTQLEKSERGFSFLRDEPLMMTFANEPTSDDVTALSVVNEWEEETISSILKGFGEERFARAIARGIVVGRSVTPITKTTQLVQIIHDNTPGWYHRGRTHYATRVFQAIRMAVNDELGAISSGINGVTPFLHKGSRITVISFHSIEDRAVKQLFLSLVEIGEFTRITKKPTIPSTDEIEDNPRSRSAKLRVIEKL